MNETVDITMVIGADKINNVHGMGDIILLLWVSSSFISCIAPSIV